MNSELSVVSMVANASVLVQLIMALLLLISLGSWSVIFRKWFAIRSAQRATDRFEAEFWTDRDLGTLYQQIRGEGSDHGSLARIFESGMSEFLKTRQQKPGDIAAMLDGSRRAMRAAGKGSPASAPATAHPGAGSDHARKDYMPWSRPGWPP